MVEWRMEQWCGWMCWNLNCTFNIRIRIKYINRQTGVVTGIGFFYSGIPYFWGIWGSGILPRQKQDCYCRMTSYSNVAMGFATLSLPSLAIIQLDLCCTELHWDYPQFLATKLTRYAASNSLESLHKWYQPSSRKFSSCPFGSTLLWSNIVYMAQASSLLNT